MLYSFQYRNWCGVPQVQFLSQYAMSASLLKGKRSASDSGPWSGGFLSSDSTCPGWITVLMHAAVERLDMI
jgi:hypothetical protein